MTLAEALRDDVVALETGLFWLLPSQDLSGRPILYSCPSRHTGEGYSAQSMVRAGISYCAELEAAIVLALTRDVCRSFRSSVSSGTLLKLLHRRILT